VLAGLIADAGAMRMDRSGLSPFEAPGSGDRLAAARRRGGAVHGRLVAAMDGDVAPEPQLALAGCDASRGRPVRRQGPLAAGPGGEGTRRRGRALAARPHAESDEEIAARLTGCARSGRDPHTVRGIGRWSAETLLIFQLRRLDVWPVGDHGVRRGYGLAWKVPTPTARAPADRRAVPAGLGEADCAERRERRVFVVDPVVRPD
jgi:DNA-3-methyladenine glycosylase II